MSSSLALSQYQEIPLQHDAQATIRSTEGHNYVCKQASGEGRGAENSRASINTYLQGVYGRNDRIYYLRAVI